MDGLLVDGRNSFLICVASSQYDSFLNTYSGSVYLHIVHHVGDDVLNIFVGKIQNISFDCETPIKRKH